MATDEQNGSPEGQSEQSGTGDDVHVHERLIVYQMALRIAHWVAGLPVPQTRRHLKVQAVRAADSAVLNIAEGGGRGLGDARRNHFRIAAGSAAEVSSVIDLLQPEGGAAVKRDTVILARMLTKLSRR